MVQRRSLHPPLLHAKEDLNEVNIIRVCVDIRTKDDDFVIKTSSIICIAEFVLRKIVFHTLDGKYILIINKNRFLFTYIEPNTIKYSTKYGVIKEERAIQRTTDS